MVDYLIKRKYKFALIEIISSLYSFWFGLLHNCMQIWKNEFTSSFEEKIYVDPKFLLAVCVYICIYILIFRRLLFLINGCHSYRCVAIVYWALTYELSLPLICRSAPFIHLWIHSPYFKSAMLPSMVSFHISLHGSYNTFLPQRLLSIDKPW